MRFLDVDVERSPMILWLGVGMQPDMLIGMAGCLGGFSLQTLSCEKRDNNSLCRGFCIGHWTFAFARAMCTKAIGHLQNGHWKWPDPSPQFL